MPKNKRRRVSTARSREAVPEAAATSSLPDWQWFTFPVFFAFFLGALIMAVLNGSPGTGIAAIAQYVVLAGISYGLARIVVRKLFAERRASRSATRDSQYEDVVVYPEDKPAHQ